jgi:hypothetical protein
MNISFDSSVHILMFFFQSNCNIKLKRHCSDWPTDSSDFPEDYVRYLGLQFYTVSTNPLAMDPGSPFSW